MLADKTVARWTGARARLSAGPGAITGRTPGQTRGRYQRQQSARALKKSNQRPDWPGDWPNWPIGLKFGQLLSLGLHHPGRASSRAHDGALLYFISI